MILSTLPLKKLLTASSTLRPKPARRGGVWVPLYFKRS